MTELASHATDYSVVEREPPEVQAANLRVAAKLWAGATAFFFIAFLFAYFYLRSLNQNGLWHPHGVHAPTTLGAVFAACVAASAGATWAGARRLRADDHTGWRLLGLVALLLGIAAIVVQAVEWTRLGFGPTNGGFASVFFGWTSLYLVFVVGSLYWLETLVATSFRYGEQGPERGEGAGDSERTGDDIERPHSLLLPAAEACAFYWTSVAAVGVVTWVVLYVL